MQLNPVIICSVVFLLTACAGQPTDQQAKEENLEGYNCLQENPGHEDKCVTEEVQKEVGMKCREVEVSGTRFKKRECTTLAQRKARGEAGQEGGRKLANQGTRFYLPEEHENE